MNRFYTRVVWTKIVRCGNYRRDKFVLRNHVRVNEKFRWRDGGVGVMKYLGPITNIILARVDTDHTHEGPTAISVPFSVNDRIFIGYR